jgi:hypothetical protein
MRIAYSNLIDDLVLADFTASGTATGFPVTNVQEQRLSVRWRSVTATAQSVVIDFGTAVTIDTAAILGHNISSGASTISVLTASDGSTWSTIGTLVHNADAMLVFASATNRYFKFSIDDPLNTDGYVEAGRLWLGSYVTISPSSLLDFRVVKRRSDMVTIGKNRQKYAVPGEGWRRFEMSFPATGGSMLTAIQTMYDTVGNHSSVIFSNFDDLTTYDLVYPVYASIEGDLSFTHDKRQKYSYSIVLEENM